MTIFESWMTSKHFGKQLELSLLQDLGRVLLVVLAVYFVLRVLDLYHRGAFPLLLIAGYESGLFFLEMILGLILPMDLLLIRKVRESTGGLYLCAVLTILGFITNRLNVSITGLERSTGVSYIPKWTEAAVTLSIIGST